ncbi:MAG: hypothetical protein SangKO_021910 [Sandaracinaceae bacterium]
MGSDATTAPVPSIGDPKCVPGLGEADTRDVEGSTGLDREGGPTRFTRVGGGWDSPSKKEPLGLAGPKDGTNSGREH